MKLFMYGITGFLFVALFTSACGLANYNAKLNTYIDSGIVEASKVPELDPESPSQILILGTVHSETDNIKRADLYDAIHAFGPDLILFESEPKKVRRMMKRSDYMLQLWKVKRKQYNLMEDAVTLKYIKYNPNCQVKSYEWKIRTQYHRQHDIQDQSQALLEAVIGLYSKGMLTKDQSTRVEKYMEQSRALRPINENAILSDLNNPRTDSLLRARQYSQYKHMADVASERSELKEFQDFIGIFRNYWDIRNKAMVDNILKHINAHPGSKIVVLNGYYHRYYLMDGLKDYESTYDFEIIED